MTPMPTPRVDREAIDYANTAGYQRPGGRFGQPAPRDLDVLEQVALMQAQHESLTSNEQLRDVSAVTQRQGHLALGASGVEQPQKSVARLTTY